MTWSTTGLVSSWPVAVVGCGDLCREGQGEAGAPMSEEVAATAAAARAGVDMYEACLGIVSLAVSMEALWMKDAAVVVVVVVVVVEMDLEHPRFDHLRSKNRWVKDEHIYPAGVAQMD